jgi:hypothetical protein
LNSGFWACKVGTLLLEPCLQSILLWLFWRWDLMPRITGVSHWHLGGSAIIFAGSYQGNCRAVVLDQWLSLWWKKSLPHFWH